MRFAPCDIRLQVVKRADAHRFDVGDLGKNFDFLAGQADLVVESNHGHIPPNGFDGYLGRICPLCLWLSGVSMKDISTTTTVTGQCHSTVSCEPHLELPVAPMQHV